MSQRDATKKPAAGKPAPGGGPPGEDGRPKQSRAKARRAARRAAATPGRAAGAALARLRAPLAAFLRRFGLLIALVLSGFLGGLGYALFAPTTYTATAYVLVVDDGDGGQGPAAVSFAQAFGRLAPLPETLAYSSIPLPDGAMAATRDHIQSSTSPDTPLIKLAGSAGTPAAAAAYANAAADALVRYGTSHRTDTGVRVALMSMAATPSVPSSPNPPLDVAVGTASGVLLAGLGAAVLSGRRGRAHQRGQHDASRPPRGAVPSPAAEPVEVHS
ncbi:Wzz/FepE/Etk N-terminal domain-containing protein [Spirillospora sp. NPDC000708]